MVLFKFINNKEMHNYFCSLFFNFCMICSLSVFSQTYFGTGGAIPDDGNAINFTLNVQNLQPSVINTTSFGLESICINVTHTWDADLEISLIAPDGTHVLLTSGLGGDGDNYSITCFNGNAVNSIVSGYAPFNGTYRPVGSLGLVNNGQNGNGTWTLHILDTYAYADAGYLSDWSITFSANPSSVFSLDSSDIPIIIINTAGQHIPDEPKITASMGIINNGYGNFNHLDDSFNDYNGYIGIELRGSSSQTFPKKPYAIETRDSLGNNLNFSLLGMPCENDWALIPNYSDKTLMRNSFSYDLARNMGYWAPRSRFCELIVNNEYQGVYALMEKIKRDDDRVNIAELQPADITGDALTGGYIIKIDKWTGAGNDGWESNYLPAVSSNGQKINFQYHYPSAEEIVLQQKTYIQAFVDSFETVLKSSQFNNPAAGYYKFIDINSFIDYFIINELSKNVDGYRLSTFLYKNRNSDGGKLTLGPVWDFDLAYRNANYCGGDDFSGWAYKFGDICDGDDRQIPFWWDKFMTDTVFKNTLQCRWQYLRTSLLDTASIFNYIDSIHNYINLAQIRNFQQWPILGVYVWPNPNPLPQTYQEEINSLKKWFRNRLVWLDDNMPGNCYNIGMPSINFKSEISFYPNPANDLINITFPDYSLPLRYEISDIKNHSLQKGILNNNKTNQIIRLNSSIINGQYLLKIYTTKEIRIFKLIILR